MGICFCSHRKVYPPSREDTQNPPPSREDCHPQIPPPSIEDCHPQNPPPSRPKKEIYYDLVTHLRESYDNADILQLNFVSMNGFKFLHHYYVKTNMFSFIHRTHFYTFHTVFLF